MVMTSELRTKWISALRSGKYQQGRLRLKSEKEEGVICYCCLGVLADVIDPDAWRDAAHPSDDRHDHVWRDGVSTDLNKFKEETGLDEETQGGLMDMNDRMRYTFDDIADFLEFSKIKDPD